LAFVSGGLRYRVRFAASSELRSVCDRRSTVKEASRVARPPAGARTRQRVAKRYSLVIMED